MRRCVLIVSVTEFMLNKCQLLWCLCLLLLFSNPPTSRAISTLDDSFHVFSELLWYWLTVSPVDWVGAWVVSLFTCFVRVLYTRLCLRTELPPFSFFKDFIKESAHWVLRNELMTHLYSKEPEIFLILFLMDNKTVDLFILLPLDLQASNLPHSTFAVPILYRN